ALRHDPGGRRPVVRRSRGRGHRLSRAAHLALQGLVEPLGELLRIRAPAAVGAGEVSRLGASFSASASEARRAICSRDVSPAALTIRVGAARSASTSGTYPATDLSS